MDKKIQLEILDLVYPGKGLARVDGCVVFLRDVLPGEIVTARIIKQRKNYAEAELINVDKPSPFRIEPSCPLAGTCPGCAYQHIAYEEELRLKDEQFVNLLQRIGHIKEPPVMPPIPSPISLGYRNKITLHSSRDFTISGEKSRRTSLGYFALDNRSIIDIPSCPLAVDAINNRLIDLRNDRKFISELKDGQNLSLRYTKTDGTIFWLEGTSPDKTRLTEETSLGSIQVSYKSFFQVNIAIANALIQRVMDIISKIQPAAVIDLYCGIGLFALAAGKAGVPAVLGIDRNKAAIQAARKNAKKADLPGVRFEMMTAREGLEFGLSPLKPEETTLIVDPPRSGLPKEVIELIAKHRPATVIYISCAPDTLARDAARLAGTGYRVESTQIFDMFPRTPYFESITVFNIGTAS